MTAQPGTADSPGAASVLHPTPQSPYASIDMNGLQQAWDVELELPMEPALSSLQMVHLTQTGAVIYFVHYGARAMLHIIQPIFVVG